jgi:hypothetical protein
MTMSMDITQQDQQPATATDSEMFDTVHRRLVSIHYAIAERTNDDKEIIPWAERELMGLIRDLGAFRRARRSAATE